MGARISIDKGESYKHGKGNNELCGGVMGLVYYEFIYITQIIFSFVPYEGL